MDLREYIRDDEEALRAIFAGLMKSVWTAMPASVSTDSTDGHVAVAQPMIKRQVTDPATGQITYEDHPQHPDLPIHHLGGGPVVTTHPTLQNDTGLILYASRAIDTWLQSGGSQQPIEDRSHHLGDGVFLSGIRSTPDKLQQVSQNSAQTRTVDKRSVVDHGPNGTHIKSVDPSMAAASANFDPFASATKFFDHLIHPTNGHQAQAVDGGTTHLHSLTHDTGFLASIANAAHQIGAHPTNGTSIQSSVAHTLQAPNASLDSSGNQSNQGSSTSKGNITSSSGNISAPSGNVSGASGQFASGFLGLLKFLGGGFSGPPSSNGALTVNSSLVAAPVLQSNAAYTVAALQAAMPAGPAYQGTQAVVTDAMLGTQASTDGSGNTSSSPAPIKYQSVLYGSGTQGCVAVCLYGSFMDPVQNQMTQPGWAWVAG